MEIFKILEVFGLSLLLNIILSMMSRARNRNNIWYHGVLNIISTVIWLMSLKILMQSSIIIVIPSSIGAVIGAVLGQKIAMIIEEKFNM